MQKALQSRPKSETSRHEELFTERYEWLMGWALRLTNRDREQAEDLVHDTFVQFIICSPPLDDIGQNVEGYLYTMLRNMHVSQVRRAARIRETASSLSRLLSLAENASLEIELKAIEEHTQIRVQEELSRICHYAILRRDSSKVGSILVLRFFHGYYPYEIAQVARISRASVDKLLQRGRAEISLYLKDPRRLNFIRDNHLEFEPSQITPGQEPGDFLRKLRQSIYLSRGGDCPTHQGLRELYRSEESGKIDHVILSHIVSCAECLDEVNRILGLPPLSARQPVAMSGKERRPRGKGGGSSGGGVSGASTVDFMDKPRRRLKEVRDHRPQELRISVNGFILGSHGVNSELNQLSISAKGEEKVGFVEVLSEREVRLLFAVVERPPDGPVEQRVRADLSDGRTLEMLIDFSDSWPNVQVTYRDPFFQIEGATQPITSIPGTSAPPVELDKRTFPVKPDGMRARATHILSELWPDFYKFWLRPAPATTVLMLFLLTTFVIIGTHSPKEATAADLLQRSIAAEEADYQRTDQVIQRTVSLEVRGENDLLVARRKIEVWQSAERGLTARRLYDESGSLIAGDWRRRDGEQTLYHHAAKSRILPAPEKPIEVLNMSEVWQLDLSARSFVELIGETERARVEEEPDYYVISYANSELEGNSNRLMKAELVLNHSSLRATRQTLIVKEEDGAVLEYRFMESSIERHDPSVVAPFVFEPNSEFISERMEDKDGKMRIESGPIHSSSLIPFSPAVATTEFEVDVLARLNRTSASLGGQVSVTRETNGLLKVHGIVESDNSKQEIIEALAPVISHSALRVEVYTVAEALKRQSETRNSSKQPPAVSVMSQEVAVAETRIPVHDELENYFVHKTGRNSAEASSLEKSVDSQIRNFSNRVTDHSRKALLHAWALRRLAERFSPEVLNSLDAEAHEKWYSMLRSHANSLQSETEKLRRELQPIFYHGMSGCSPDAQTQVDSDIELFQAMQQLFGIVSAHDRAISHAFTVSPGDSGVATIKSEQFWRSLCRAESLAASIKASR